MNLQLTTSSSGSSQRRFVIGDVHGHYEGLMQLLESIAPGPLDDVYFLGDLIDRGPGSAKVMELVRQEEYTTLIGNHEQMLIDAFPDDHISMPEFQAWLYSGGLSTFKDYGNDLEKLIDDVAWLRKQLYQLDLGDVWLVHAGLNPRYAIAEQTIEDVCWIRDQFHSSPKPYFSDKLIITGHTITFTFPKVEPGQLVRGKGWLDIDTGAYHRKSGWLTALDLDRWIVHQVHVHTQELRQCALEEIVVNIEPSQIGHRLEELAKVA
jgi:serine/threonine protein phosphatase 1